MRNCPTNPKETQMKTFKCEMYADDGNYLATMTVQARDAAEAIEWAEDNGPVGAFCESVSEIA